MALEFLLGEEETTVRARLEVRRAEDAEPGAPLVLHGEELDLRRLCVDGEELAIGEYEVVDETLTVPDLPAEFVLETEVVIRPAENTALQGLYVSNGIFCTQCEAEGFRRITYFPDRPDVMARYTVRIEADRKRYPVLLSNGNRMDRGDLDGDRHWVLWEDPFPKPSYLFALVAGDLRCHRGDFTTRSGRTVPLEIWVEPQNIDKCEHALASLQRAMKWDEEVFGLEVDLDLYMIVAVDDFNMGAMENKGLNVFNSKFVLARPDTATDDDYEGIAGVVAHEYFHNWTGNRVTCRDWFQLTLKEGLTVYRDQEFSADETSRPVQRIADVRGLRERQFDEDAGPMAHPIRPESYIEMNNFYTATVYEKGAEVVRLYERLLGKDGFRRGMDLYFERHDGQAVTCDDFRAAMADANGVDLTQLERWYSQAGTPVVRARGEYDAAARTYTLTLGQDLPRIADLGNPEPLHVPVLTGLLGADGADLDVRLEGERGRTHLLELREAEQSFTFEDVAEAPVPSLFRGFSAPVKLALERSTDELAFLMANDSDPFSRWDAGQELGKRIVLALADDHAKGRELSLGAELPEAFGRILADPELDDSFKALALSLPFESVIGQEQETIDPDGLFAARRFAARELARTLRSELLTAYRERAADGAYRPDKRSIDRRRLKNRALSYLVLLEEEAVALAADQFAHADNMTDYEAAFAFLCELDHPEKDRAVDAFHVRWKDEPLVLDKWFRTQACSSHPKTLSRVVELAGHPDFRQDNPNRVRSLVGAFALLNQVRFHGADGGGYEFLGDQVAALDPKNPQLASRLVQAFNRWRRFDGGRQALMKTQLERIAALPKLSKDVGEVVGRALESPAS